MRQYSRDGATDTATATNDKRQHSGHFSNLNLRGSPLPLRALTASFIYSVLTTERSRIFFDELLSFTDMIRGF